MTHYDAFNGDADGICALHQLRLADPKKSTLVTGVKRDINLLAKIEAVTGDTVTTLDVSLDKNRKALEKLLAQDISVTYFDHHFPGDIPQHARLNATIDTDPNTCTSLLVNQYLNSAYLAWAVTAAFGDNLFDSAVSAAKPLQLDNAQLKQLETLGTLLNYNGYGSSLEDLFFAPDKLYLKLQPYVSPFDFIANDDAFQVLDKGYQGDMTKVTEIAAEHSTDNVALFVLPDSAWARRVSGVYGNQLARDYPTRGHALLTDLGNETYIVSVRAPLNNKTGADELCRQFATGGGRKAAAGINALPAADINKFITAFEKQFAH